MSSESTQDLFEYVSQRVIERLVERVPGATEESERAWFDEMLQDWIRAQQPGVEGVDEDLDEAEVAYRTPEEELLHKLTITFGGAAEERVEDAANVPEYDPPPLKERYSADLVQLWMSTAYEPWPDLPMERAAQVLSRSLSYSVPQPPLTYESVSLDWARFSVAEARALVFELHQAGVDVEALLKQIEAFPYDDVSLVWLIEPERCIYMHTTLVEQMKEEERERHPESLARLRHTAEFVRRIATLIPPHVRIWLRGWSAAYVHAAFARAVGLDPVNTEI
jgi:hypothetical protein